MSWPAPTVDPTPGAHGNLVAISPPAPPHVGARIWRCHDCQREGTYDELFDDRSCTRVFEPCEHCGGVRICASDCAGIMAVLGNKKVIVVTNDAELAAKVIAAQKNRGES